MLNKKMTNNKRFVSYEIICNIDIYIVFVFFNFHFILLQVIIYLVANKIGYKPDSDYFKDIVDGLFDEHDKNKDGLIAYDEFVPRHDEL